jgi:hypothetical protein
MNQNQINRSQMLDAVKAYLDQNASIWSAVPIIEILVSQVNDLMVAITVHKDAQNAARVFVHKKKKQQKLLVAEKADILNDALQVYAGLKEDAGLENKAAKSYSVLYMLRNEDFKTVITETISLLEEKLTALADYGVAEPQITDLKNSFNNFLALNGQPRQYRISSVVATESLKELFTQSSKLLRRKLDKVMKRFKNTDPKFYKGYLAARVVVDN